MSTPPAVYWRMKAELCRDLAHRQLEEDDIRQGVRNLFRMTYALNMAQYMQQKEEEGE